LLEGRKRLKLPWLPISLHHDGFAILAREKDLEEWKKQLKNYARERIKPVGSKILELEFTPLQEADLHIGRCLRSRK
jgi:hypothetical protein